MEYLQVNQYRQKRHPIIASAGYKTTIYEDISSDFTIAFQEYVSKEELSQNWASAIKRSFDLSIAPNGDLFENWHQCSGLVKEL